LNAPACVARAREFAQARLAGQLTSHEAAAAAGVCPQYFCRRFKAATGSTFTEYVGSLDAIVVCSHVRGVDQFSIGAVFILSRFDLPF
jgi:methylphosphotriester-DNA--protein-cysteine methyltransferase